MKSPRSRSLVTHLAVLAAAGWLSLPAFAHSGDEFSAWAVVTPTIDGVLSAGEWADADSADFTLAYCAESHDVTLYVKNDATNLYLAVVVRNEEYSNLAEMYHDFANFYFDNGNDGSADIGEDGLAIRFDGAVVNDTHNPNGVNGWSYSDASQGGTNDLVGAVTHTNPVPDGVGDYTFEYQHPLDSADNAHDFSLSEGDTVGFRFSFPDGEATCSPISYHWPSSAPSGYGDIIVSREPNITMLAVPMNWSDTQAAFDSSVDTQLQFFIDATPLSACPEEIAVAKLDVVTENFNTFTCSMLSCGVSSISPFVSGLGINPADYDFLVGLIQSSPCSPIAGCSNGTDTIWVETTFDVVAAHEIGHLYGLEDEYCSNPAGSTDCRCNDGDAAGCGDTGSDAAATGDLNYLDATCTPGDPCDCPADGAADCTGSACCNFTFGGTTYDCATVDYGICCIGNRNTSGGRAIMSFADAEIVSPGTRAFDVHSIAHFATIPELSCSSPERPIARRIIDLSLEVSAQGEVQVRKAVLGYGRPSRQRREGRDYEVVLMADTGKILWRFGFDAEFDYDGPRYLGVDYRDVAYGSFPVQLRIPYQPEMRKLVLRSLEDQREIFSTDLSFCNEDKVCGPTETNESCPGDCPLDQKDKVCTGRADDLCDPDCAAGQDPDCQGDCGNGVCNADESYRSCSADCPSGGRDEVCDGVADGRCDADCLGQDQDADCGTTCGDGTCAACPNETDSLACENSGNCPRDCPTGGEDHYCDGAADGVCDPDCDGEDPDCEAGPALPPWIIILILVLLVLATILWVVRRSR